MAERVRPARIAGLPGSAARDRAPERVPPRRGAG